MPSTMPAKYYIYAGGRWCEVDTLRGRVAGFRQRGRFCFLSGGKLEIGRTSAVLRALRALAAGSGGAARDAVPLLGRRPHRSRRQSPRGLHCCSQHLHHSRCDVNDNEVKKAPTFSPRKRKRSTSEDTHKAKLSRSRALLIEKQCQTSPVNAKRDEVQSLLSSSDAGKEKSPKKSSKIRGNEEKLAQILPSSSEEEQQKKQLQKPRTGPKARGQETLESSDGGKKLHEKKSPPKSKPIRGNVEEQLVQSLLKSSSSEDNAQVSPKDKPRPKAKPSKKDQVTSSSSESSDRKESCKELVIDDEDVRVLRGFLARGAGGEELERFDRDEEYKTRVFYKLNPLVLLKRCGPLEQLLLQRLSLQEFARHLGLRSVADVTPEKRYRMRHSTRQARNITSVTSGSEADKEVTLPKRRQLWNRDKELFDNARSFRSSELKVKPQIHRPRDSSQDSSDSDTEVKKHIKKHLERRASAKTNPRREEKPKTNAGDKESIVVASGSSDSDTEVKKHAKKHLERRASARINPRIYEKTKSNAGHNDSIVVPSTSGSSTNSDVIGRKSRRTRERKDSVVVSDDSEGVINRRRSRNDEKRGRSRRRVRGMKEDDESVVVSDDSNDGKQGKRKNKAMIKSKTDDNDSVVISDESDSKTDNNSEESELESGRRTRAQGSQKRVLREHNKSVVISDDTDNSNEIRANSRTKTKAQEVKVQHSVVVSDSNTDENKTRRTRPRGPDIALKEQNRRDNNAKKETDKAKKEIDCIVTKKTTRSSIKGADDIPIKDNKPDASKNNQQTKNKEQKAGPSSKTKETSKDQDKSVISDSDDAFETQKLSPKKNKTKDSARQLSAANTPRNRKGRFLKRKEEEKEIRTDKNEKEKQSEVKVNEDKKQKEGFSDRNKEKDKENDNYRNETDKQKIKQKERDRVEKDKENSQSSPNKRKEIGMKSAVARSMFIKPVKFKKSSVANGREYTSLEDHAIVAWVSLGNRERKVNGNAVWRELEREYPRLTTQKRTWHSLRNRYLRYILPSLGALALPPAQVSRLRAAAAQGCLRPRPGSRRNSIFAAPRVRSAAAAATARRRPGSDSGSETDGDRSDDRKKERTPPPTRRTRASSPSTPPSPRRHAPPSPKSPAPPAAPRSPRMRARTAATPTPKKKRIHHL